MLAYSAQSLYTVQYNATVLYPLLVLAIITVHTYTLVVPLSTPLDLEHPALFPPLSRCLVVSSHCLVVSLSHVLLSLPRASQYWISNLLPFRTFQIHAFMSRHMLWASARDASHDLATSSTHQTSTHALLCEHQGRMACVP